MNAMNAYANLPTKELFDILDSEIERYQIECQAKVEAARELKRKLAGEQPEPIVQPNRYENMEKRDAIADVLRLKGEPATVEEIGAALQRGGMKFGDRGFRDLRTAVTMNEQYFFWDGNNVNLREWKHRAA